MSSSMYRFLLFYLSTIILFLATIAQQCLRKKIENVYWKIPPPPNSVILIFNFLSFRKKTQWDVPSWDSSPSSEEEHPYVVPEPDHTSTSAHSYVDMDEVRQTSSLIVATTSLSTQNEI